MFYGISPPAVTRAHADAIGSVVAEIQENAGNPERIRMSLAQAGHRRFLEGVERAQLDMLGPILAHLIRSAAETHWTDNITVCCVQAPGLGEVPLVGGAGEGLDPLVRHRGLPHEARIPACKLSPRPSLCSSVIV